MFEVTDKAKEMLSKSSSVNSPETVVRLQLLDTQPNELGFVLDQEREADRIVKNSSGITVMVINSELAKNLSTAVLDVQNTQDGDQFILTDAAAFQG